MAMHKVQQRQLPLVLLVAGLTILPGLAGESKSSDADSESLSAAEGLALLLKPSH
jgi:hypothetical protein